MTIKNIFRRTAETIIERIEKRRRVRHKQYWQAGALGGGGAVSLGLMTETEALARLQVLKGDNEPVVFVDFERGFIAYGKSPEST